MNPLIAAHHGDSTWSTSASVVASIDRAGGDEALPRARRILAQLAELPPVAVERLPDHAADLGEIRDDRLGELPHHRMVPPLGKITVRASAPM